MNKSLNDLLRRANDWPESARADSALAYTAENYPTLVRTLELRIRAVVTRIGR
jgi:hypothetical protein